MEIRPPGFLAPWLVAGIEGFRKLLGGCVVCVCIQVCTTLSVRGSLPHRGSVISRSVAGIDR